VSILNYFGPKPSSAKQHTLKGGRAVRGAENNFKGVRGTVDHTGPGAQLATHQHNPSSSDLAGNKILFIANKTLNSNCTFNSGQAKVQQNVIE
jgi:hypothetical protein